MMNSFKKKLSSILMLLLFLCCSSTFAQGQMMTINVKKASLKQVFKVIERQTTYRISYRNVLIDNRRDITMRKSHVPVSSVLDDALRGRNLDYSIVSEKSIVIADKVVRPTAPKQVPNGNKRIITGTVRDSSGEPIIGASVMVKGSKIGIISDANGRFSLEVPEGSTLAVSYIGYRGRTISTKDKQDVSVVLNEDAKALNEVVVIGYGTAKKEDLTGSVVNVKMNDVKSEPVLSVDQALQGRVAGADFLTTSGEPGSTTSIRIRGTRSISATNEPLIVVDGVMDGVHDLADLNAADIQSISVLKDASSTAIYGSRGSNGVIIVTTKKGAIGKTNITFKGDVGFSQLPRYLDLMNAKEFCQYRNDYALFATSDNYGTITINSPQSDYPYPNPEAYGEGTNWVKEITHTAPYQNYMISMSGGSQKSSYYFSFAYNDTRGIIQKSGMKRYTGRFNADYKIAPWLTVGMNASYTFRDQDNNLANIGGTYWWSSAIYLSPLIKPNESYNPLWFSGQKFNSPRSTIDLCTDNTKRHMSNYSAFVLLEPIKGLKVRSQATYYLYQRHSYEYEPSTLPAKAENEGGYAYRGEYDEHSLLSETTVTWQQNLKGGHHYDVMGGFTAYSYDSNNLSLSGKGYQLDEATWNNMGAIPDKENYSGGTSETKKTKMSFLSRFNYNYKGRYYFTFTGRWDGSSNFAKNHKWGFFPSAAIKWNVSNENFLKDVKWIDEMSIRTSFGRTGNDGISPYRSLSSLGSTTNGYLFGGSQPVAFYPSSLASDNLTWEKTDLYNLGIDLSLFNNRINITAEGYLSYTKDLLLNVQTPTQTGYSSRFSNVGKTSNKGVEFSIESQNIVKPNFGWTTSLTLSHNKQKVVDIGTNDFVKTYSAYGNNSYMMYGYVNKYPLNALWGFKYGGTWKSDAEVERNNITKAYVSPSNAQKSPGCARYYDINHDGIMNEKDLIYLGNADPWLYSGIQNTFRIYNFSIGVYFVYSLGGKIYNVSEQWLGNGSSLTNQYRYMLNAWHPVRNPNSDIPRAGNEDNIASSRMVHSATYLRLKNVTIGYNFDLSRFTHNIVKSLKLSATAENLYLWKKYNGFDPDVSSEGTSSTLRRVDIGAYPNPRTFIFSIQMQY
jgi:TonB-linked SusC/RagA family outer membrane protein